MFTGIVQYRGKVSSFQPGMIAIDRTGWDALINPGDSVCVSGVCLTAVQVHRELLTFDVVQETLSCTKLGYLNIGDPVNLECAVTPNQPLGGHFMQGHVDGIGQVVRVVDTPEEWRTAVKPPADLLGYIVPKGSVAIDGVSLTIAAVRDDGTFEVALIPETLSRTTLGQTREGSLVNLEADILAKTVVNWLERTASGRPTAAQGVTMDLLRESGFAG